MCQGTEGLEALPEAGGFVRWRRIVEISGEELRLRSRTSRSRDVRGAGSPSLEEQDVGDRGV